MLRLHPDERALPRVDISRLFSSLDGAVPRGHRLPPGTPVLSTRVIRTQQPL